MSSRKERARTPSRGRGGEDDRGNFPSSTDRDRNPNNLRQMDHVVPPDLPANSRQQFARSVPLINLSGDRCDFTESVSSISVFDLKLKLAFQKDIAPRRLKILCECVDEEGVPSEREMTDAERLPAVVYPVAGEPGPIIGLGGSGLGGSAVAVGPATQPALAHENEQIASYRVIDAGPTRILFEANRVELRNGHGVCLDNYETAHSRGRRGNSVPESVGSVRISEIDLVSGVYIRPSGRDYGFDEKIASLRKATNSFTKLFGVNIEWTAACTCEEMVEGGRSWRPGCWRCMRIDHRRAGKTPEDIAQEKATEINADLMRFCCPFGESGVGHGGTLESGRDIHTHRPLPISRKGREVSIVSDFGSEDPTMHHLVFVSDEQAQRFSSVLLEYAQLFSDAGEEAVWDSWLPEGPGPVRGEA